jgi:hypothetical protein
MKIDANTVAVMAAILYAMREQDPKRQGEDLLFADAAEDAASIAKAVELRLAQPVTFR